MYVLCSSPLLNLHHPCQSCVCGHLSWSLCCCNLSEKDHTLLIDSDIDSLQCRMPCVYSNYKNKRILYHSSCGYKPYTVVRVPAQKGLSATRNAWNHQIHREIQADCDYQGSARSWPAVHHHTQDESSAKQTDGEEHSCSLC